MSKTETLGNAYWNALTKTALDVWFGPRAWRAGSDVEKLFLAYDGTKIGLEDRWDCLFVPVMEAIKQDQRVVGMNVDFTYPPEQRAAEENDPAIPMKRVEQLGAIAPALKKAWQDS